MTTNKKINEGLEHIKIAEKHLKTSLLKWRPDYDLAADAYSAAATCFKIAKSYEKCKDSLLKSVDCYKQNRALFSAGKNLEHAFVVSKEMGDYQEILTLAERAAHLFQSHGSGETAASTLDKAAKILESQRPQDALQLYQHAADISMIQDNSRQTAEYVNKVSRLFVKQHQYDLAADSIRRELGLHQQNESYQATGRLAVALVLVQLARGDVVAAEKAFKEWGNYCESPEIQLVETLLQAYDEEDAEAAKLALNNPFIKHMDVEYSILARDMPLPEGIASAPKVKVNKNAAPSYVSQSATSEGKDSVSGVVDEGGDDEMAGGLC